MKFVASKYFDCFSSACPCNVDPLTHHFYIEKWGFQRYTCFLIFALKHCGYSLEPRHCGGCLTDAVLTSIHNLCFEEN